MSGELDPPSVAQQSPLTHTTGPRSEHHVYRSPTAARYYSEQTNPLNPQPPTMASSTTTASSSTSPTTPSPSTPQAEARAAVLATLNSAGATHDSAYRTRISDLHANSSVISTQEREVKAQTATLAKESAKLDREVGKATEGLKGVGDVQNWAEVMEREFMVLEETLRLAEGRERAGGGGGSGGSEWR